MNSVRRCVHGPLEPLASLHVGPSYSDRATIYLVPHILIELQVNCICTDSYSTYKQSPVRGRLETLGCHTGLACGVELSEQAEILRAEQYVGHCWCENEGL